MKKNLLNISAMIVVLSLFTLQACKDDDTAPPVISLNGSATVNHILNSAYTDADATATDDEDGAVSVTSDVSSSNPNKDLAGTYIITYTAMDAAGNEATATRTVIVYNEAEDDYEGTYDASEVDILGPYTYVQDNVVTASSTINNQILLTRLGDFANNTVYINVTGTTLTMPSQTNNNVGTGSNPCDVHDRTSQGTGVKTSQGFTLTYNDSKEAPCTGSRTGVVATFIKQ